MKNSSKLKKFKPVRKTWSDEFRKQQLDIAKRNRFLLLQRISEKKAASTIRHADYLRRLTLAGKKAPQYRSAHTTYPIFIPLAPYGVKTDVGNGFGGHDISWTTVNPSSLGVYTAYRKQWNMAATPGFASLPNKGKKYLRDNAFDAELRSYSDTPYVRSGINPDGTTLSIQSDHCCGINWFQPADYGMTLVPDCRVVAHNRLHDRVNRMHTNVAQMFAERKQTVALTINAANRIVSAARALKHANWRDFSQALSLHVYSHKFGHAGIPKLERSFDKVRSTPVDKRLANHWLEYTFGWVPLLSDIYGSAELLASHALGELYHEQATGSCVKNRKVSWFDANRIQYNLEEKTRVKYVVKYELDSYARAALSQTGLDNPLLLAWELMPYSFVIDWFYPVQNYLKKLNTFDGFIFRGGTYSTLQEYGMTVVHTRDIVYPGAQPNRLHAEGAQAFKQVLYHREALGSWPTNIPPTLRNPLGNGPVWKLATSLSLLRQLFH